MSVAIEVSAGELLDKISILEIKAARIRDPKKRANVVYELTLLNRAWSASEYAQHDVSTFQTALREVNARLWDIEEEIRAKELIQCFDAEFVALARAVYLSNDERAALKHTLNERLGSVLIEEKSYTGCAMAMTSGP